MLEGLDKIDWHRLKHAYGPADDVPEAVRSMLVVEEDWIEYHEKWDSVYGALCHQGTVSDASVYVLPILIDLLHEKTVPTRVAILGLIGSIAIGLATRNVFANLKRKEPAWIQLGLDNVRAGIPTFLALFEDDDPDLRMAAAEMLTFFVLTEPGVVQGLHAQLQRETHPQVRLAIVMSLGVMPTPDQATHELLTRLLAEEQEQLVRVGAAMVLAKFDGPQVDPRAIAILRAVLDDPEPVAAAYQRTPMGLYNELDPDEDPAVPWEGYDIMQDAAACLRFDLATSIEQLLHKIETTTEPEVKKDAIWSLVWLTEHEPRATKLRILARIVDSDNAWKSTKRALNNALGRYVCLIHLSPDQKQQVLTRNGLLRGREVLRELLRSLNQPD